MFLNIPVVLYEVSLTNEDILILVLFLFLALLGLSAYYSVRKPR